MRRRSIVLKGAYAFLVAVVVTAVLAGYFYLNDNETFDEELHIAVDVPPYYIHDRHRAEAGRYSEGLGSADDEILLATVEEMDKDWENIPVVAMYIAALRLFETGERDRALYWYQGARYRADLFLELLDDSSGMNRMGSEAFSLSRVHTAFFLALKPYLGGHGLCGIRKYEEAMDRAVFKRDVTPRLNNLYPDVVFLPEAQWPGEVEKVKARFERRLTNAAENYAEIVKRRKATGIHNRYCEKDGLTTESTESTEKNL